MSAPLRVIQWATGNIGSHALRSVIEHPGLELAGVYVTSAAKSGRDAGDLCGLPATGVTATSDIDEITDLGADCVLYIVGHLAVQHRQQPGLHLRGAAVRRDLAAAAPGVADDQRVRRPARQDTAIAAGVVKKGAVAAQRMTVTGIREEAAVIRFVANWYCTDEIEPAWSLRETGWHVSVAGDAPMEIDIRFPVPLERMAAVMPGYTANRAVNAIPAVCAAPAGIRTTADLPQILASLTTG